MVKGLYAYSATSTNWLQCQRSSADMSREFEDGGKVEGRDNLSALVGSDDGRRRSWLLRSGMGRLDFAGWVFGLA